MPRQRLGVALLLSPPVSTEIDALRRALGDDDVGRIGPHVTLVPPVNVREEDLDAAAEAIRRAAATTPPLRLRLGPVATFAPVNPTLHLAVDGDLDALRALREAVFVPPLERSLTHAFVPHVTLVEESDRIDAGLAALAGYRAEVVIDCVHLMRESRDAAGVRVWRPIADARLGARPAVIGRGGLELELTASGMLAPDASAWLEAGWRDDAVDRYGETIPAPVPISVVGRRDGRIVGAATGEVRPRTAEAYLAELLVAADVRGEGIGAHLVAAFQSLAAEHDARYVTLRTEAGGRAQPFYERLGFVEHGVLRAWRNGLDFVTLRKEL